MPKPATILPPSTPRAHRASSQPIPSSLVPTEPSEAELATCEQRLDLTARRDRQTVPARARNRATATTQRMSAVLIQVLCEASAQEGV
jgi:hypothetical protein